MILDDAIAYRRRGFSVIPIQPKDKKPKIGWEPYQKEPPSEVMIQHWFESWPNANLGLVTGAVSDCVVLDLDTEEAKNRIKEFAGGFDLAGVPRSKTGKGWQLFFKHPQINIPNRAGVIPGLDVRGDGGYVVAPPSIHPNGKQYKWEVALNGDLPALPEELLKLISAPTAENGNSYRERFNTAGALHGVPEGQRDQTLFKLACKLRSADVPQEMAEALILEAAKNCEPGFPERIALEKVARVYHRYEAKQPVLPQKHFDAWPELLSAKQILSLPPAIVVKSSSQKDAKKIRRSNVPSCLPPPPESPSLSSSDRGRAVTTRVRKRSQNKPIKHATMTPTAAKIVSFNILTAGFIYDEEKKQILCRNHVEKNRPYMPYILKITANLA